MSTADFVMHQQVNNNVHMAAGKVSSRVRSFVLGSHVGWLRPGQHFFGAFTRCGTAATAAVTYTTSASAPTSAASCLPVDLRLVQACCLVMAGGPVG